MLPNLIMRITTQLKKIEISASNSVSWKQVRTCINEDLHRVQFLNNRSISRESFIPYLYSEQYDYKLTIQGL